jgi:hypothetical protein
MDTIWKNAAKKLRARDLRDAMVKSPQTAPVSAVDTTASHQKPATILTAPNWSDPETVTVEQIDENSRRLLREWPKEDGIPFPREILETLRDLKLKVLARDAERKRSATVSSNTSIPDPQGSIYTTTSNPMYPTTAIADLWRKTAKKAAKIAYQREYYGTTTRLSTLTRSRAQPVTTITSRPAAPDSIVHVATAAPTLLGGNLF